MIMIYIGLDRELLCIARVFSQFFSPYQIERIKPSLHKPAGTPGNIFSALLFLRRVGFVTVDT